MSFHELATPWGVMYVEPLDGNHVTARAGYMPADRTHPLYKQMEREPYMRINGVSYLVKIEITRGLRQPWRCGFGGIWGSRADTAGQIGLGQMARQRIVADVIPAVLQWAETHPDEIAAADRRNAATQLRLVEREIAKAEAALTGLYEQRTSYLVRLK